MYLINTVVCSTVVCLAIIKWTISLLLDAMKFVFSYFVFCTIIVVLLC